MASDAQAGRATRDPAWVKWTLIGVVVLFLTVILIMPIAVVFTEALKKGFGVYWAALSQREALSAIGVTAWLVNVTPEIARE